MEGFIWNRPASTMRSDSPTYMKGALFGFAAVSIWASWSAVTRLAVMTNLDSWDIVALRFGVAGLLLSPVGVRRGLALAPPGWLGVAGIMPGMVRLTPWSRQKGCASPRPMREALSIRP